MSDRLLNDVATLTIWSALIAVGYIGQVIRGGLFSLSADGLIELVGLFIALIGCMLTRAFVGYCAGALAALYIAHLPPMMSMGVRVLIPVGIGTLCATKLTVSNFDTMLSCANMAMGAILGALSAASTLNTNRSEPGS